MRKENRNSDRLVEDCLAAFIAAGTLDLSLDQLGSAAGISKRMLIHYFGSREILEQKAFALLEDRLRDRISASQFLPGVSIATVVIALWDQSTTPQARGTLLLIMDVNRRGWSGSERAKAFYVEQQRLWVDLLLKFLPDPKAVEEMLQLFQGAILVYLVTGDREPGRRALLRMLDRETPRSLCTRLVEG
ncbi:MAG: TetR/AcrR family transcriptional regulator [Terracidiphilus sp.]